MYPRFMVGVISGFLVISMARLPVGFADCPNPPGCEDPDPKTPPNVGPDVILGVITAVTQSSSPTGGRVGDVVGLGVGTTSCNKGDVSLNWFAASNNDHPVIAQNLYRLRDDRFEQIGQSWVKHAFAALQGNACGFGCTSGCSGNRLCPGCSDPYSSSLNASQSTLGSRAWINPFTGEFPCGSPCVARNHSGHAHNGISHRLQVHDDDLDPLQNIGALYFSEGQYITPHEYCPNNGIQNTQYNNVSYRQYDVSGTRGGTWSFPQPAGGSTTIREEPALNAWTGATQRVIEPDLCNDGIAILAYRVTQPATAGGLWHYEYALYNMNLDRAIREFIVPVAKNAQITNVGFHAPPQHAGELNDGTFNDEGFSDTPWDSFVSTTHARWATETIDENPNANAIRWGTLYNFRFDSARPPLQSTARIWMFKTCQEVEVTILAPDADCNNNGVGDTFDISSGASLDDDRDGIPDDCVTACHADFVPAGGNGFVDINDLRGVILNWGECSSECQSPCPADIAPLGTGDTTINTADLREVILNWGPCNP